MFGFRGLAVRLGKAIKPRSSSVCTFQKHTSRLFTTKGLHDLFRIRLRSLMRAYSDEDCRNVPMAMAGMVSNSRLPHPVFSGATSRTVTRTRSMSTEAWATMSL